MFEGGSDVFTSNRHTLHNNEARSFNMMNFRTQDDAPFFRPSLQSPPGHVSATVPVEREACERVTSLMLRSNTQVSSSSLVVSKPVMHRVDNYILSNPKPFFPY